MQPVYVEVWCEKDAVIGSIEDVTDKLGVTVRVGRGFQSATLVHEIAERFSTIKKPKVVFYLGDHDPSGLCIEQDLYDRTSRLCGSFRLERLAIFAADIKKFRLPPLRIKQTDTRALAFLNQHSNRCVELDALPPEELRRRIEQAVEGVMDTDKWNRAVDVEAAEIASIEHTLSTWPGVANVD
jgi:hypothetical protein